MDKYTVEIVPKAEKEFLKLPEVVKSRVRRKIFLLEDNPRPLGSKKLKETEYYRIMKIIVHHRERCERKESNAKHI